MMRFLVGTVFATILCSTSVNGTCMAQVQLPLTKVSASYDCGANLMAEAYTYSSSLGWGGNWTGDSDLAYDTAFAHAYYSISNADGIASADIYSSCFASPLSSSYLPAFAHTYALVDNEADLLAGDITVSGVYIASNTAPEFEIEQNTSFPTTGVSEGSATINAMYFFQVNGIPVNRNDWGYVYLEASVSGIGSLTMEAIDFDGEYFHLYGTLNQKTSEDSEADDLELDEVVPAGPYYYNGTRPTQVGDHVWLNTSIHERSEQLGDGSEYISYQSYVEFKVFAP